MRGIYHAHSRSEDEVVFPALEAKRVLRNVSHAYALDHAQEETQFEQCSACLERVLATATLPARRAALEELACLYAGVRGSLETHIRAEETELWPLFAEHFPVAEQEHLVGLIIGRSGADVLTAMLPWVRQAMTPEEEDAMMLSLRSAASSTAFEAWLGAALGEGALQAATPRAGGAGGNAATELSCHACGAECGMDASADPAACAHPAPTGSPSSGQAAETRATLAEVARYLESQGLLPQRGEAGAGARESAPATADASTYTPGWDEIFRMNQKQLEAAVRRVSADTNLEPGRKAYLIQNLMASRYVVAQQRLLNDGAEARAGRESGCALRGVSAQEQRAACPECPARGAGEATGCAPQSQCAATLTPRLSVRPGRAACRHAKTGACRAARHYTDATNQVLGCRHYRRRAMLVAPCCGRTFVCRFCHDEASDHAMDRYAVREMVCMECGLRQPVAGECAGCRASMARYYCKVCHLFDDDPAKDIYHCPFCNFCRQVG